MQPPSPSLKTTRRNFFEAVLDNPIILKELKGRMRGRQGATLVTVYLALIVFFIAIVYFYMEADGAFSSNDPDYLQKVGKAVFFTVVTIELLMIAFIAPALTSGAIASERDRQTFDLLRVSMLSPRGLLLGKLGSAVAYLLLLIFTAIPLQSMAFFLGGVGMAEMIVSLVMLVASVFLFCMLGLYFSTVAKRAIVATSVSYGFIVLPVVLEIVFLMMLLSSSFSPGRMTDAQERAFMVALWVLLSVNPLASAALSETMLIEEHSIFLIYPPNMHPPLVLLSPWIFYVIYAFALTVLMIWLSVFYLKRHEY